MNAEHLLTHFDRIADAPDAVPRLRRFILDLAVRGKLVEQDPNDEPASELLKRIVAEKKRLVKAGEIRKPRHLDDAEAVAVPFEVPQSWKWARLDSVGAIIGGGTPSANETANFAAPGQGIPWLTPADLGGYSRLFISRGSRDLSETGLQSSSATLMPKGTVLFTSRAPIGYVAIAANPISTNQGFKSIVPYVSDCSRFVALSMKAFASEINAKAPGTTFKEVSGKIVASVPFPLPPLAEQHRIVAKVDELMALCDRLETARKERENTRNRVTAASLARLNTPDPDPAVFQNHAAFALDNLTSLTTRPDQIKALRQTILNLAVRGKLVDQESSEGGVDDLLEEFGIQQKRLIAEKKLKHSVSTCNLEIQDNLASIPNSWCWVPLGKLISFGPQNGVSPRATNSTDAPKAITLTATTSGAFDASHFKHVEADVPTDSEYWLRDGDLLFQRGNTREYVGIAAYFSGASGVFLYPDLIMKVRLLDGLSLPYVHLALVSPGARTYFSTKATGTQETMPKINQQTLLNAPVPLPPLAEQHRIVAKVDELMALCDRLEANLARGDETRGRLVDTLLHEALEPATGGEVTARPNPRL